MNPLPFTLDEEFRVANRPQTKQERLNLEYLIDEEGCSEGALTVAVIGDEKILIDGYSTLAICQQMGFELAPPRYVPFKDREEVLEWIHRRSRARRNLTPEEMADGTAQRRSRVQEEVNAGKSIREIAKEEGVDRKTIVKDVDAIIGEKEAVTGHHQKTSEPKPHTETEKICRPCRIRAGGPVPGCKDCNKLNANNGKPDVVPDFDEEEPKFDANFVSVPAHALPSFAVAEEIGEICRDMDDIVKRLAKILANKVGARLISQTSAQRLADVRSHLWQSRPTCVCAYCQGEQKEDCKCRGEGWLSMAEFAQAPKEFQDSMRKMGARNVPI